MKGVEAVLGPSAVIKIGGVETVVITNRFQAYDRMFFVHFGIIPEEKSLVAVKSAHHFRAAYGPMAREIMLVDAAGITSPDPNKFPIKTLEGPSGRWMGNGTIDRSAIEAAEGLIRPYIRRTPVLSVTGADFGLGEFPLSLKLEFMQHSGSFKCRGS